MNFNLVGVNSMLPEHELAGYYHSSLISLSVILAMSASFTAINLVSRIQTKKGKDKLLLLLSSIVMGGGIWGMHFIGMLAFHLGIPIKYHAGYVLLSFLLAVGASMLSFWIIAFFQPIKYYPLICGVMMSLGISSMHYLAMKSMKIAAEIRYDPSLMMIAISLAFIFSWIGFTILSNPSKRGVSPKVWRKITGVVFFGIAISSMHFMGMRATKFLSHSHPYSSTNYSQFDFMLASIIGSFILLIIIVIFISSSMDERYSLKLSVSEKRYRQLVELAPIGIVIHKFGVINYVNPAGIRELGGSQANEIIGKNILDFIHPDYHEIVQSRWAGIKQNKTAEFIEEKIIRLDHQVIDVEMMGIPIMSEGERQVQIFFQNISDRKKAEKLMYQMAYHDPLTGLPNRRMFFNRLNKTILETKPKHMGLAVMFIDLDGFKQVNDFYGHETGDMILIEVGKRLTDCVHGEDTVSRLAGDEYSILLQNIDQKDAVQIAQRIIDSLNTSIKVNDKEVLVTPSIGISFYLHDGIHPETLLKQADMAMYEAKKHGKNNYQIYNKG